MASIRNFDAATPPGRTRLAAAACRGWPGLWPGSGCALRLVSASPFDLDLYYPVVVCASWLVGSIVKIKLFRRKKGTLLLTHTVTLSHTHTRRNATLQVPRQLTTQV